MITYTMKTTFLTLFLLALLAYFIYAWIDNCQVIEGLESTDNNEAATLKGEMNGWEDTIDDLKIRMDRLSESASEIANADTSVDDSE